MAEPILCRAFGDLSTRPGIVGVIETEATESLRLSRNFDAGLARSRFGNWSCGNHVEPEI